MLLLGETRFTNPQSIPPNAYEVLWYDGKGEMVSYFFCLTWAEIDVYKPVETVRIDVALPIRENT
jgi:hypothetical protein